MENVLEIRKDQLLEKLGHIVSVDYIPTQGETVEILYLWGVAPIKVLKVNK